MIIKPLDPIADFGASSAARRVSQRPPPTEPTQQTADAPQSSGGGALEEQAKAAEQRQQEAETQTPHVQGPSLRFHVDQDTGRTIAELVDTEGQVLRQVPTEEALRIAKAIGKYQGMFVDLKV
jgi:flagellar protein FlaG